MNEYENPNRPHPAFPPIEPRDSGDALTPIDLDLVEVEVVGPPPQPRRPGWRLPLGLFVLTCASTYFGFAFYFHWGPMGILELGFPGALKVLVWDWYVPEAMIYSVCVMTILLCHEMGHFLQARRYGVRTSYPIFLPMPISPIGTLGAVIAMDSRIADRKALFDIGITGPLAGLVPTLAFCWLGLHFGFSRVAEANPAGFQFGEPLIFKLLAWLRFGPLAEGQDVLIGPMAIAGWVGLLITALNLLPIGQLDGGHILYALFRRRAHVIASTLLAGAVVGTIVFKLHGWWLMLLLLILMGPRHPPTSNDYAPLGKTRILLGWLMLAFLPLGFTPDPFPGMDRLDSEEPAEERQFQPPHQKRFQPPPSDERRWV